MPRIARMLNGGEQTVYHVISRTALDGYPFGDIEKDELVKIFKKFSTIYFVDIFGFCIMGNHFHLLVKMYPGYDFTDEDIQEDTPFFYGDEKNFAENKIESYREKWSNLSEFVKDIKQSFSRFYNKLHNRKGTLWGERFKSVIVEEGQTLINCLAYIDVIRFVRVLWHGLKITAGVHWLIICVKKSGQFFIHGFWIGRIQCSG